MNFDTKIEEIDFNELFQEKNIDNVDIKEDDDITIDDTLVDDDKKQEIDDNDNSQQNTNNDEIELSDDEKLYNSFASELYKKGIFTSYENVKNEDDLYNTFIESVKQNEYKDLTEQQIKVLEAFRSGIPESDIIYNQQEIADYSSISENDIKDNSSLRENILYRFYINKGMDDEEAKEIASVINSSDSSIQKTTDALLKLKENAETYIERIKQENDKKEQDQIEQYQKTLSSLEEKIKSIDKIDNVKISEAVRNKAFKSLTENVGVDEYGNQYNRMTKDRLEDPIDFEARVALFYELTNGFKDFKNISRTIQTKEASKIGEILKKKGTNKVSSNDFSFLDRI